MTAFINKETPRYFVADFVYKVSKSGFVYSWSAGKGDWIECCMSIVDLINFGGKEITQADFTDIIINTRAKISQDGERWFVMVDSKHLYEFDNEYDALSYAQRVNAN